MHWPILDGRPSKRLYTVEKKELEAKVSGQQAQIGELLAQNSDLQNNIQESVRKVEESRVSMASMVQRMTPGANLKPFFDELLAFLANNMPLTVPLPLLDLVEIGCEFPPGIEVMEKPELPAE